MNIAIIFGGKTCEHEISCISASQVIKAIDRNKYQVIPLYLSKNNEFYIGPELNEIHNYYDLDALVSKLTKVTLVKDHQKVYLEAVKPSLFKKVHIQIDFCLLATHGTSGEDGMLQGYLELLDLPYSSSGHLASALAQDKAKQKIIFKDAQIPCVSGYSVNQYDYRDNPELYLNKNLELSYPIIIKPSNLGSSIGIEVCHNALEFQSKIEQCFKYDICLVVEKYLQNFKEINCAILGNIEKQEVSVLEEVLKENEILDFSAKYENGHKKTGKQNICGSKHQGMANAQRIIPANLSESETAYIKQLALKAYKALGASGVCRIDFIYDLETKNIYIEELNNIPGSLAFYLWDKLGINFTQLIDRMIKLGLDNYRLKNQLLRSFDTNILANFKK